MKTHKTVHCCECGIELPDGDEGKGILTDCPDAADGPLCEECALDLLENVRSVEADDHERGLDYGPDPGGW
jgi:hypothetical protein